MHRPACTKITHLVVIVPQVYVASRFDHFLVRALVMMENTAVLEGAERPAGQMTVFW